jgi:hypothetical protein
MQIFFLPRSKILQKLGVGMPILSAEIFISHDTTSAKGIASISSIINSIANTFPLTTHAGLNNIHVKS